MGLYHLSSSCPKLELLTPSGLSGGGQRPSHGLNTTAAPRAVRRKGIMGLSPLTSSVCSVYLASGDLGILGSAWERFRARGGVRSSTIGRWLDYREGVSGSILDWLVVKSATIGHVARPTGRESLALMNEAYEDEKLSQRQVYFWYKCFKDGRKNIADDSRSGRPLTSTTVRNIGQLERQTLTAAQSCLMSCKEVAKHLDCNIERGLSWAEADHRQGIHGPNELVVQKLESLWMKYLEQFKNPLILLLMGSALISVLMHQFDDAASITLLKQDCFCSIREGLIETFLARNLVPGDIVLLGVGDRVPADIRLFEVNDLAIDESAFTGETEPALKVSHTIESNSNFSSRTNIAYMGTLVRCGTAKNIFAFDNFEIEEKYKWLPK
ncbi:ATP2C1 [Cordylochernes scorpioides]|uniref:P-type Ca(2+) transporter n=1 Tax=Cordylochernes scorpioides TaxID=51811 RepID=A0ABY6LVC4_9ARAC|nr:ATP2C1 [Cordylochernes scorpioides]